METRAITEIFGEYRCGKTQLCHTLAVMSQINPKMPGKVAYIDTEGTFRPKRIADIARYYNLTPDDVMDNVICVRIHNSEQQMTSLEPLMALMVAEQYKLIVVVGLPRSMLMINQHILSFYYRNHSLSSRVSALSISLCRILSLLISEQTILVVESFLNDNRNSDNISQNSDEYVY